jgi:hypothetical protein
VPLAAITFGVNAGAKPTSATSRATEDVRLTNVASGATGSVIRLA